MTTDEWFKHGANFQKYLNRSQKALVNKKFQQYNYLKKLMNDKNCLIAYKGYFYLNMVLQCLLAGSKRNEASLKKLGFKTTPSSL